MRIDSHYPSDTSFQDRYGVRGHSKEQWRSYLSMTEKETNKFLPPHLVVKRKVDNHHKFRKKTIMSPAKHKLTELQDANRKDAFTPRLSQCLSANFSLRRFRLTLFQAEIRSIFAIEDMSNKDLKDRTGMKEEHCLLMRDTLQRARDREKVQARERELKLEEARKKLQEDEEHEQDRANMHVRI
jgi:hypothetical protein